MTRHYTPLIRNEWYQVRPNGPYHHVDDVRLRHEGLTTGLETHRPSCVFRWDDPWHVIDGGDRSNFDAPACQKCLDRIAQRLSHINVALAAGRSTIPEWTPTRRDG